MPGRHPGAGPVRVLLSQSGRSEWRDANSCCQVVSRLARVEGGLCGDRRRRHLLRRPLRLICFCARRIPASSCPPPSPAVTRPRGTAPCAAPRPRGALWRKADLIGKRWRSLSDLDCSLQMARTAMKRAPVTAVLTDRPSMLRPEMKSLNRRSCGADQNNGQPIKRRQKKPPTAPCREQHRHDGREQD
jgi:hypothetical protein